MLFDGWIWLGCNYGIYNFSSLSLVWTEWGLSGWVVENWVSASGILFFTPFADGGAGLLYIRYYFYGILLVSYFL
jgi:hypothetical protein